LTAFCIASLPEKAIYFPRLGTMKISKEQIQIGNVSHDVSFPDTGNAAWHIKNILSGKDYPVLNSKFVPTRIVDIGANVGATSLFFTGRYPTAEIYCYEPSPTNLEFLQKNTSAQKNIQVFEYGLSDRDARTKLYLGRAQCLQHSIHPSLEVTENHEDIELRRASSELANVLQGRCILKIDTEGCEVPILRDLKDYFAVIDIIYLEYHSEQDRRSIDELLCPQFKLWHSEASVVHRGNQAYVSSRLLKEFPELEKWEVKQKASS